MDSLSMDLITKLVILATAIVGLYKAATFSREKSGAFESAANGTQKMSRSKSSFSALFELVGVLLFMLAFPAFIWGFSWITRNIASNSSLQSHNIAAASLPLSSNLTAAELAYVAANNIQDSYARTASLTEVVGFVLKEKDFKIAILAATAIPDNYAQSNQLKLVISAIQQSTMPNSALQGAQRDKTVTPPLN